MLQEEIEDVQIISEWLSSMKKRKVSVVTPKKGTKEKLVELAYKNAQMVLLQDTEKIKREEQRTVGAMQEIADWLSLPHLVRAEAYDISNTSGIESVGSMVVFENGRPKKNDYRKFKIKTVKGPDDYKSMREVLGAMKTDEVCGRPLDPFGAVTPMLLGLYCGLGYVCNPAI